MTKFIIVSLCAILTVTACNKPVNRKVLILGQGGITANGNDITMKDGSGAVEETVEVSGAEAVSWNVTTPTGKSNIEIPKDPGFYVLNLKKDTLVGSEQVLGKDISSGVTITQEQLKVKIDSLTKLTKGENASTTNRSYFILPSQVAKISANKNARVFGPFNKIPGTIDADENGKAPEIYKLYTNKEMREVIANFRKATY